MNTVNRYNKVELGEVSTKFKKQQHTTGKVYVATEELFSGPIRLYM